ncbi:hypothetical protein MKW92_005714 [Papaver armeniacum]|nr:hypothetical protein MKW92_005714 [Papaver armeniacum]
MFQRQWSKLQRLSISDTNVNGSIPISISNAPLLVTLSAHSSSLQGYIPISISLPSCFTELKNLTFLEISRNSIGGTISLINFINELNLTYLDLSSNRLTVVIDQRFHLYSKFKLEYLALPSCNLKGIFPTFICKLPHLYHLDLSDNYLEGVIPSYCISKLQISGSFNLSNNKLHGPLPLLPQGLYGSRSTTIDLSNSKLSGKISTENGKRLSSFHSINLAGNYLPTYIDFSNNNLSGIIPTTIGYCSDLEFLNLGSNNLTGNAPSELEHAKFLIYLQLHENNLDGTLPDFFSKLQDLKVLNLANNNFGGSIPTSLGSIMWLRILSLRSNKLNGTIPREIFNSYQLQILDLSQNALSGHIPKILGMYWKD